MIEKISEEYYQLGIWLQQHIPNYQILHAIKIYNLALYINPNHYLAKLKQENLQQLLLVSPDKSDNHINNDENLQNDHHHHHHHHQDNDEESDEEQNNIVEINSMSLVQKFQKFKSKQNKQESDGEESVVDENNQEKKSFITKEDQ